MKKPKEYIVEGTATADMPELAPDELIQIALSGADVYLKEHPNISPEKRAVAEKILKEQQAEKQERLKAVLRRYKICFNRALVYEAQNKKDPKFSLKYQEPTTEQAGYITLSASQLNLDDKATMKAISGANSITVQSNDNLCSLTFWFKDTYDL